MRRHQHRYVFPPALETFVRWDGSFGRPLDIDGELYWAPGRRGNVPASCRCGKRAKSRNRLHHPFTLRARPNMFVDADRALAGLVRKLQLEGNPA